MSPENQRPGTLSSPLPFPPPPCLTRAHIPPRLLSQSESKQEEKPSGSGRGRGGSEGSRELAFISPASLIPTLIPAQQPVSPVVLKLTLLQAPSRQPFLRSASSGTSEEEPEVSLLQPASLAALKQSLDSQGATGRGGYRGAVPGLTFWGKR